MRIVIATHNEGKVRELAELFAPIGIETVSAGALGLPEPEETGASFAENAKLKAKRRPDRLWHGRDCRRFRARGHGARRRARHPFRTLGRTGQGFRSRHGPRQSRAARQAASTDRSANFTCALALAGPDAGTMVCIGKIFGTLVWPPRGNRGFGYDPIFVPDGETRDLRRDGPG